MARTTSSAGDLGSKTSSKDLMPHQRVPPREVQLSYIGEIVKLMLRHMHQVMSVRRIPFLDALTDYVDIYRKTSFYNLSDLSETERLRPQWDGMVTQLEDVFNQHLAGERPADQIEEAGLQLLWPHLVERIDRGLPIVDYKQDTTFGCFFFAQTESAIDLHFVNKLRPVSPFERPLDRATELYELLRYCSEHHPQLKEIKFGSWLNEYPPYRRLFPPSWRVSGEGKKYNSLGWWGQFMNRCGDFHRPNAKRFRETGDFPYQCEFHHCPTQDLEEHLVTLLKDGK